MIGRRGTSIIVSRSMLPLIPALLLLILNGAPNAEQRLGMGPWSAAIRALYARTETSVEYRNGSVDRELAKALCSLLRPESPKADGPGELAPQPTSFVPADPSAAKATEGFADSCRSRDGPVSR